MKRIKIILGIITTLILAFFLTGLVVGEVVYTNEVQINKPVNEVFADFQNVDLMKQWMPEVKSIETLEEKTNKVGSTYRVVVDNQGRMVTMTEEILAFEENKRITFHFDAESISKIDDYVFFSEGNTTKIIQTTTSTSESYIMSCLLPYFKSKPRRISQQYLDQFKKASEAYN
ncbi:SRPBCC family protein [Tenacibaculum sp.]|uniref:SRPBCC family protein n=1 Tax=Tenacibaculum sp. TaxID=1906242 RepID=UPI003D1409E9